MNNTSQINTDQHVNTFKGYKAIMNGKVVYVINEGFVAGTREPALKVKIGNYVGCTGWSGGRVKQEYSFNGRSLWVRASTVKRK